ncbi:uncharacterized protein [Patagioenas fasciata]|uniref:uncharacterized protein isoform X2 n=1 Tax=Patagioenas fasciata TaxID=372321 RepID=UPI003A98FB7E
MTLPEAQGCSELGAGPSAAPAGRGDPAPAAGHGQREAAGRAGGTVLRDGDLSCPSEPSSSPAAPGAFPVLPGSSIAAPLPGTLQPHTLGEAVPGQRVWGWTGAELLLPCPACRPPEQPSLLCPFLRCRFATREWISTGIRGLHRVLPQQPRQGGEPQDRVSHGHPRPVRHQQAPPLAKGPGCLLPEIRAGREDRGAAGRGAQGPAALGAAADRHACHCRAERRGEGAGGQGDQAAPSLLLQCLLAPTRSGGRGPSPLLRSKSCVSSGSPRSLCLLPYRPVPRCDQRSKAGQGLSSAVPPSPLRPLPVGLATSSSAGCSAHSGLLSPGLSWAQRSSAGVVPRCWEHTSVPWEGEGWQETRPQPVVFLQTVRSMDNMLEALLLNSGASRASELLHNIFQMLLTFGSSEREHVRQRALGRIEELSFVLAESPTLGPFAEHLQPPERTDLVLVLIKALTGSSTFDKQAATNLLDMVERDCGFWLVDVPKITSCIHKTLGFISTAPARQRVASLIVPMADKCPAEVVSTLLTIAPPGDSTALALWEVMFSVPQTLQNVLKELLIQLQDRHCRVLHTCWEDTSILRLAMLASSDLQDEEFAAMYLVMRFLREQSPKVLSLVLRALMTLSEREEMARKMKVMLPDLAWVLQYGNNVIKTKALVVFINVMAQLEREEASAIAVLLANLLLPFFDDELSQLRESSIGLFRHLMKMVVGNDKTKMKNTVRLGLLPLFFRMSDQVQSVAKVAREALLGAAELLKWKQLRHLVQTQQTWRIGESLLERDRSRAQELLSQSLPYLRDAQPSLREAALRFIGLAARHLRDPSEEELAEICRAIQPLEGDSDPSVCSLAAQTVGIVCSSWKRPRSRWSLRALCCWR